MKIVVTGKRAAASAPYLERGEGREDGATDPDGVLALRGGDDLDLHGGGCEGGELLGHALGNALEHGGAAGHDNVGVEVAADVHVALHDGLEGAVVHARGLLADERGLEQHLGAPEAHCIGPPPWRRRRW